MGIASITVLPGSPEVAETIQIELEDAPPRTVFEIVLDRAVIGSGTTTGRGRLSLSIPATGLEVALANYGHVARNQLADFTADELTFGLRIENHHLELRPG